MLKDLQIKDLCRYLICGGIRIHWLDTGEEWQAKVDDFTHYADMYITGLRASNNNIIISMKQEI